MTENKDNYLYMGNDGTEIEIGDFYDSDMRIYGSHYKPFIERFLNLFTPERQIELKLEFGAEESKDISNIMYRKYLKKVENSGELTFNVERTSNAAIIPTKAHPSDSGFDLYSPFEFTVAPGDTKLINFHIKIQLEPGWEAQVRNRSGIVTNYKCMIPIGVGTIDCFSEDMKIKTIKGQMDVSPLCFLFFVQYCRVGRFTSQYSYGLYRYNK